MARYSHSLSLDATIMVSKNCPSQSLVNTLLSFSWHNRLSQQQDDLLKRPLITALRAYNSKMARWNIFILSTFDKHHKAQFLAKFKEKLCRYLRWFPRTYSVFETCQLLPKRPKKWGFAVFVFEIRRIDHAYFKLSLSEDYLSRRPTVSNKTEKLHKWTLDQVNVLYSTQRSLLCKLL